MADKEELKPVAGGYFLHMNVDCVKRKQVKGETPGTIYLDADGTVIAKSGGQQSEGTWVIVGRTIIITFTDPLKATWTGSLNGNLLSGDFTNFEGVKGCWYAEFDPAVKKDPKKAPKTPAVPKRKAREK